GIEFGAGKGYVARLDEEIGFTAHLAYDMIDADGLENQSTLACFRAARRSEYGFRWLRW
ncbi:MAG: hypothetical protein IIB59_07485, partial [Planctomycetes bacterium]|nr:hypothetical protein [Planctomycetota bacterium]